MYSDNIQYFENTLRIFIGCASKVIEEYGPAWTPLYVISKCTAMLALLRKDGDDKLSRACQIFNDHCDNIFGHEIEDMMFEKYDPDIDMNELFDGDYDRDEKEDEKDKYDWEKHKENWSVFYLSRTCARLIGDSMHIDSNDDDRIEYPSLDFNSLREDIEARRLLTVAIYDTFKCMRDETKKFVVLLVPIMMSALGLRTKTFHDILDILDTISLYTLMERVCYDVMFINSSIVSVIGCEFYSQLMTVAEEADYSENAEVKLFIL